jgi:hypothetical protein
MILRNNEFIFIPKSSSQILKIVYPDVLLPCLQVISNLITSLCELKVVVESVTEPPKILGPLTYVLNLKTSDIRAGALNGSHVQLSVSPSHRPIALIP